MTAARKKATVVVVVVVAVLSWLQMLLFVVRRDVVNW